jgi:hypothetical protein
MTKDKNGVTKLEPSIGMGFLLRSQQHKQDQGDEQHELKSTHQDQ